MQCIAIIYKRGRADAAALARELSCQLEARGVHVFCAQNIDDANPCRPQQRINIPESAEAVVVLGGDGTFLSVARFLEDRSTPIVGVNLGGLGFLTEITKDDCFRDLLEIFEGPCTTEERMRLMVEVHRRGREIFRQSVLNDAVINKGALARIVDLKTSIDGRLLTNYRADGLIVATPTGSTAYNLSAGGPIVYPTAHTIILTPICPFTLTNRPIIMPSEVTVEVEVGERAHDVDLTCDGQVGCALMASDRVVLSASSNPLRLLKSSSTDYFEILRTKLKWGHAEP
ncbi:MAG: NAD(+)/NADH kinase [Syntrophobacteraceae bacterium]